ncbi:Cold-shock protein DNA-binding [Trinorchestia longiramus]|nr:Cold-shock protein DNA-binding [Trinorchestia longiramus]
MLDQHQSSLGSSLVTDHEAMYVARLITSPSKRVAAVALLACCVLSAIGSVHCGVSEKEQYGTVKWFNTEKGFGFITPDNGGPDVFVHFSTLLMDGFRNLQASDRVKYVPVLDIKDSRGTALTQDDGGQRLYSSISF